MHSETTKRNEIRNLSRILIMPARHVRLPNQILWRIKRRHDHLDELDLVSGVESRIGEELLKFLLVVHGVACRGVLAIIVQGVKQRGVFPVGDVIIAACFRRKQCQNACNGGSWR